MNCFNCGKQVPNDGKFCQYCGAKLEREEVPVPEPGSQNYHAQTHSVNAVPPVAPTPPKPPKKKKVALIAAITAAVILVVAGGIILAQMIPPKEVSDEDAEGMIETVVEELQRQDYSAAARSLRKINVKDGSKHTETLNELEEIVNAKPKVASVDTSNYPTVTVELKTSDKKLEYKAEDFAVVGEDSSELPISSFAKEGNKYRITYLETEEDDNVDVDRKLAFRKYKNVEFAVPYSFTSKEVKSADLELVTSNVVEYPEVSLYMRVVDEDGNTIENLDTNSFVIREYLDVNDYLERDVIYAAKVDGQDALNVSLSIDRSSSISDSDMSKIKDATNTFLSKLQFDSGDKAEVVAFDTNVMQMCLFTNNKDNLMNGVNSMFPYGATACYDAIVRSIQNASVQSGARCVIVFTDGLDNESVNTVDSVIRLAQDKSVPVYTIGVGTSLDESALKKIASSTGGTYHHIDDISSMSEIYDEIYREQKNMYHIKYVSDTAIPQDKERSISVQVSGNGYRGTCEETYTPVVPISSAKHDSRYEVIKADISWEDANRVCIDKGGHLATITSKEEEDKIIAVAEASGVEKLWIGGYTTNDQYGDAVGHWVMGEPFVYENWFSEDEPSRFDSDNAAEFYLMLWKISGRWSWNDQRNDLINSPFANLYAGKMGYVIEYED